jgi:hypothetical protein
MTAGPIRPAAPQRLDGKGVCLMAVRKLRIYTGPESFSPATTTLAEPVDANHVRVTFGEILPLLADAVESDRTWLSDFAEDEVMISSDLNDVLQAYRHFRRPGA